LSQLIVDVAPFSWRHVISLRAYLKFVELLGRTRERLTPCAQCSLSNTWRGLAALVIVKWRRITITGLQGSGPVDRRLPAQAARR